MESQTGPLKVVCRTCDGDGYIYTTEDGYEFVRLCECQHPRRSPKLAPSLSWLGQLAGRVTALNEALGCGETWAAAEIGLAVEAELVAAIELADAVPAESAWAA